MPVAIECPHGVDIGEKHLADNSSTIKGLEVLRDLVINALGILQLAHFPTANNSQQQQDMTSSPQISKGLCSMLRLRGARNMGDDNYKSFRLHFYSYKSFSVPL